MEYRAYTTRCLVHQMDETQPSPVGLVCPRCKHRLYAKPPKGDRRNFWESQPLAYTLDGKPCFVYSLMWDDFRIRSLYIGDYEDELSASRIPAAKKTALGDTGWIESILRERGMILDFDPENGTEYEE